MKKLKVTIEVDLQKGDDIQPVINLINGTPIESPYLNNTLATVMGKVKRRTSGRSAHHKQHRVPFLVTEVKIAEGN